MREHSYSTLQRHCAQHTFLFSKHQPETNFNIFYFPFNVPHSSLCSFRLAELLTGKNINTGFLGACLPCLAETRGENRSFFQLFIANPTALFYNYAKRTPRSTRMKNIIARPHGEYVRKQFVILSGVFASNDECILRCIKPTVTSIVFHTASTECMFLRVWNRKSSAHS